MKIDIHSHILPGIDDGAKTLEESVQLVTEMAGWGFERLTCTPHITKKFRNTPETIKEKFDTLVNALSANGLNIDLRMSAEYRLNPETWPEILKSGQFMPIEDRYILMEFPINEPSDMGDLNPMEEFLKVMSLGLTPILPHPERYFYLQHDDLLRYVDAGVKIQSNYGSLAGVYGSDVCKRAQSLIDEGIVSFLATDMHNMQYIKTISSWLDEGNQLWDMQ
jgi:tyrosine-protein phosphatase YwqE